MPWTPIRQPILRLFAATLAIAAPTVIGQTRSPFTVGIVEANGNLVPVATFDGRHWSSPWPLDRAIDEAGPVWSDLPEEWHHPRGSLRNWTLWAENTGPHAASKSPTWNGAWIRNLTPRNVAVVADGLVRSEMGCSTNFALSTDAGDFRSSLVECDYCCPEPKRGIATTHDVLPLLVPRLAPNGDLSQSLVNGLTHTFDALESRQIERHLELYPLAKGDGRLRYSGHWLDPERRRPIPLLVRNAFRVGKSAAPIYYLEIERSYRETPTTDSGACPGVSVLRAWVRTAPGAARTLFHHKLDILGCDEKGGTPITPVVYWEHESGIDLLVRRLGWEWESYAILTIGEAGLAEQTKIDFRR